MTLLLRIARIDLAIRHKALLGYTRHYSIATSTTADAVNVYQSKVSVTHTMCDLNSHQAMTYMYTVPP